MNLLVALMLALAVGCSFSSRIEVVAVATVTVLGLAWVVDRRALGRVLRVGLVLAAVFAAAAATAAVAWASGVERGIIVGGTVLLRVVVLGTTAALVARSVDAERILRATSRIGLHRLGLVFGLALNSLPHLSETATTVWSAHRIRSGGRWAALRRVPALAEVLLAHTARVADQAAAAAALRGHAALGRFPRAGDNKVATVVVTGHPGSGKTPLVEAVATRLQEQGTPVAGFVQPAMIESGEKAGFSLRDVGSGATARLARRVEPGTGRHGTSYSFFDEGFELARRALQSVEAGSVLIVDELGPVELRGGGHWPAVQRALVRAELAGMVVVVRRSLVPALIDALGAEDVVIFDLEETDGDPLSGVIGALGLDA